MVCHDERKGKWKKGGVKKKEKRNKRRKGRWIIG
jgi:hypothetical protein